MIATPSPCPSQVIVPLSSNIFYHPSTLPPGTRPASPVRDSRFTRMEFRDVTGLSCRAVDKFVELGFIEPLGVWRHGQKEIYYSVKDAKKVRVMMALMDGRINLSQAHEKAGVILTRKEPKVGKKVREALDLLPLKRFIDRPYEMPSDWKSPNDSGNDSEQDTDASPKLRQVNLTVTHADKTHESKELSGNEVPEHRDWEDRSDDLWLESRCYEHRPVVSIRMEDESGQSDLQELSYDCSRSSVKPVASLIPRGQA